MVKSTIATRYVQGGDGGWLPGFVDFDLGCSTILLGQKVSTVAAHQPGELPKSKSSPVTNHYPHPVQNIGSFLQLGNHDEWRVGTRYSEELMDAFNMISLTLPGVSVTYQGSYLVISRHRLQDSVLSFGTVS